MHSEHPVSYVVDVTYNETAQKLGPEGATLPAMVPNKYDRKRPDTLNPGVEGTTSSITIPRGFLTREDNWDGLTAFDAEQPVVAGDFDATSRRIATLKM